MVEIKIDSVEITTRNRKINAGEGWSRVEDKALLGGSNFGYSVSRDEFENVL